MEHQSPGLKDKQSVGRVQEVCQANKKIYESPIRPDENATRERRTSRRVVPVSTSTTHSVQLQLRHGSSPTKRQFHTQTGRPRDGGKDKQ